jgi:nucleoside-diphosphate-sugar epimerase
MKVLVTGATGFIGRYLIDDLESAGIDYVTLGRNGPSSEEHIQFDLLSDEDLVGHIKRIKPTHLIHMAWYAEHGKYWESSLNIGWLAATSRLVEAFCQSGGKHVVITGTCAEYDWRHGYCVEDLTPLAPKTLYGISKNSARSVANQICKKYGVGLAWARVFFPYGLGESPDRLIPSLFSVFRGEKEAFGVNASSYRDLLHVSDVARAISICSQKEVRGGINISSGEPLSLRSVVNLVASIYKKSPDIVLSLESSRLGEPKILLGANEKIKAFGWSQKVSFEDGLNLCK